MPDGETAPSTIITATPSDCSATCSTSTGKTEIQVDSHPIVQSLGVKLSYQEKEDLIQWERQGGKIQTNLGAMDKTLKLVAKFYENKGFGALSKAITDLAKGVKLSWDNG